MNLLCIFLENKNKQLNSIFLKKPGPRAMPQVIRGCPYRSESERSIIYLESWSRGILLHHLLSAQPQHLLRGGRWPEAGDLSSDPENRPTSIDCLLNYACSLAYVSQIDKCNLISQRNRERGGRNSIKGSVVGDLEWSPSSYPNI